MVVATHGTPMTDDEAMDEVKPPFKTVWSPLLAVIDSPIGLARSGSVPVFMNAHVGRHVVNENWEDAVMTYLAMEGPNEGEEAQAIRQRIRENGIYEAILEDLPVGWDLSDGMIEHLLSNPTTMSVLFENFPPTCNS